MTPGAGAPGRRGWARRATDWLATLAGLALLGWLLHDTGLRAVQGCLVRMGWAAILAPVPYTLASLFDALGWRVVVRSVSAGVPFVRLCFIRLAGEAVNSAAPTGVGGEPLKAVLLRTHGVSGSQAAAAVVIDRTSVTVTQSLLVVAGITALLVRLDRGGEALVAFVSLCALAAAFGFVLIHLQRSAPAQLGMRLLSRIVPRAGRAGTLRQGAAALDTRLSAFYRGERGPFVVAGCWHLLSWLASSAEVWLLFWSMGAPISWRDALIIDGLAQPIRATAIIVPGALGTQESGGVALCVWLGIGRDVAVAVWLVRRARELLFDAIGLLYLVVARGWVGRLTTGPVAQDPA